MKIRADFVTNSSSSSYCSIHIAGSRLVEILEEYEYLFESDDMSLVDVSFSDDEVDITIDEEMIWSESPSRKSDIAESIIDLLSELTVDTEVEDDFVELIEELKENKKEINQDVTSLVWEKNIDGWGGEYDIRFNREYDDDFIRKTLNLADDEEITEDDREKFELILGYSTGRETIKWTYDGKKVKTDYSFELV